LLQIPPDLAGSLVESMNLIQDGDSGSINNWVEQVLAKMPEKVAEYKKGKRIAGSFLWER
jgi:aspartyl-tRNA(Asn)/glutamyl-tRNA(Gln) amidotransferase subunit B